MWFAFLCFVTCSNQFNSCFLMNSIGGKIPNILHSSWLLISSLKLTSIILWEDGSTSCLPPHREEGGTSIPGRMHRKRLRLLGWRTLAFTDEDQSPFYRSQLFSFTSAVLITDNCLLHIHSGNVTSLWLSSTAATSDICLK